MQKVKYTNSLRTKADNDCVLSANYLHHELGFPEEKIRAQLKLNGPLLDKIILPTREKWIEMWNMRKGRE
ncbi:MAG: hypothetical protein H0X02_06700 [Nitrosomonas sp.]|nr:hypothetical protein [Nitrosomonas sp.]